MVAKFQIIRPVKLHTSIPEDLMVKLQAYLYSPLEQRIPKGAYQDFICDRIREFFDSRRGPSDDSIP